MWDCCDKAATIDVARLGEAIHRCMGVTAELSAAHRQGTKISNAECPLPKSAIQMKAMVKIASTVDLKHRFGHMDVNEVLVKCPGEAKSNDYLKMKWFERMEASRKSGHDLTDLDRLNPFLDDRRTLEKYEREL